MVVIWGTGCNCSVIFVVIFTFLRVRQMRMTAVILSLFPISNRYDRPIPHQFPAFRLD